MQRVGRLGIMLLAAVLFNDYIRKKASETR